MSVTEKCDFTHMSCWHHACTPVLYHGQNFQSLVSISLRKLVWKHLKENQTNIKFSNSKILTFLYLAGRELAGTWLVFLDLASLQSALLFLLDLGITASSTWRRRNKNLPSASVPFCIWRGFSLLNWEAQLKKEIFIKIDGVANIDAIAGMSGSSNSQIFL